MARAIQKTKRAQLRIPFAALGTPPVRLPAEVEEQAIREIARLLIQVVVDRDAEVADDTHR